MMILSCILRETLKCTFLNGWTQLLMELPLEKMENGSNCVQID